MNLTWHIFKKDFVRLRLALGLLVVMMGVEMLLNLRLLSSAAAHDQWYGAAEMCANLFTAILRVVVYILVASLVLDDPLLGSKKMFWVTRPISGGRLLRAKLIGLVLLFFVLPCVVRLPWWLYCAFGWKDLGVMAIMEFAVLIVIAVPAVALASLSGEGSKFLLYSLLLIVAIAVMLALNVVSLPGMDSNLVGSRFLVGFSLALISGVLVSVWLYLTRRFVGATVFVAIVVALVLLCQYCWPWNLEQLGTENRKQLAGTEKISVEIVSATVDLMGKGSRTESDYVTLQLRFKNVPDDLVLLSGTAEVEFSWPDGTVIRPKRESFSPIYVGVNAVRHLLEVPAPAADAETDAKNRELARRPLTPVEAKSGQSQARINPLPENVSFALAQMPVTPEQARRLKSGYSTCRVAVRVEVARPEVLLEVPLKEGVEQVGSGLRLHLLALEEEQQKRVEADGRLTHGFKVTVVNAHAPTNDPKLFVVNRRHGLIGRLDSSRSSRSMPLLISTRRQVGYVPLPQLWRTDKWIDAPDYLADSTLVVVTNRKVGGFNCETHTDRLETTISKTQ
jgi:hypothetical protein